jgi:hypothetical protein
MHTHTHTHTTYTHTHTHTHAHTHTHTTHTHTHTRTHAHMHTHTHTQHTHTHARTHTHQHQHQHQIDVCPDNKKNLSEFSDYANLEAMITKLHYASNITKTTGAPFFLNYGIHKPHLPFHFPAEFGGRNIWEAYGNTDDIALPTHEHGPTGMPPIAFTYEMDGQLEVCAFGDCATIPGPENGTLCTSCGPALPDNITRAMRKGYYSSVSWVDFLVGQMLR